MRFRNSLLIPVVGVAVLLGGVATRSGMVAPLVPVASAQSAAPGTATVPFAGITVSGSGTATAAPDVAYVSAGVTTQAAAARQASDANSTTMTAVIAAIKAAGVADKDVQTTNFSISPVYSQVRSDTGISTITGYRVDNSVRVTVHVVGDAAKVLDAVVGAGANSNVSISFGIADTTALQEQALAAAVQQAAGKAGAIAQATGVKLAGVYSVTEQSGGGPVTSGSLRGAGASVAVPIQQGQLSVQATVQVTYAYSR